jgi:hypothetical protein
VPFAPCFKCILRVSDCTAGTAHLQHTLRTFHAQNLDGKCARELATSEAIFELLDEPKTAFTY